MTQYFVESIVCRAHPNVGDRGDWWIASKVMEGDPESLPEEHVELIRAEIQEVWRELAYFIVGIYPYSCNEYEEEERESHNQMIWDGDGFVLGPVWADNEES